jgi:hypothetical protein
VLGGAAGELEVADGLVVDREDGRGRAEFGAHVADRRAVRERHGGHAVAVELHELADHTVLAQQLRNGEHEVGRGGALGHRAGQLEPDDPRDQHRDRLAEHGGLRLDAADAPTEHAETVDHRRVRVGADHSVRICGPVAIHHHARQVLDVDLVHDAGAGWHDLELVERRLSPAEELVALLVAAVLELDVALERVRAAEDVGDDRVVDDELGRRERVDLRGIAAEVTDGLAHRGEVDDARHTREVLHEHAGRGELDFHARVGGSIPLAQRPDVGGRDVRAVLGPQQVLEQDLQAERQALVARHLADLVDVVARVTDA